jgi:hypothetical protein
MLILFQCASLKCISHNEKCETISQVNQPPNSNMSRILHVGKFNRSKHVS